MTDQATDTFLREREKLIYIACRVVESRAVAEELVQDSWLRWHQNDYPAEKAQPIFRRIVANLARDWYRRQCIEREMLAMQMAQQTYAPDSETICGGRQDLALTIAALQELPDRTCKAFRLHRLDAMPYAAIGKELCISPSTAHKLVEDALVHIVMRLRA